MIRLFATLIMLFLIQALHAQPSQQHLELFFYKKSTPFSFENHGTEKYKNIIVHSVTINNDKLQKVSAYIIEPRKAGKYPVAIFQHGGLNDNNFFLEEAKKLSRKGIICLLIEAPWLRPAYKNNILWANTAQYYRQGVIDIKRSIDFISTRKNVDASNIAFVGHSYGAQLGGILSGIEPRIKAYVIMSGTSNLTDLLKETDHPHLTYVRDSIPLDFNNWLQQMEPLNPIHYIKHADSPVFLQFATNDEYNIDEMEAKKYVTASTHVTEHVRFYTAGHELKSKKAEEDRAKWLIQKLKVKVPDQTAPSSKQ